MALAATFFIFILIDAAVLAPADMEIPWQAVVLPIYGIVLLVSGLAAGFVGLFAILRRHERSWLVWLSMLPGLFVVAFFLGEFLEPH